MTPLDYSINTVAIPVDKAHYPVIKRWWRDREGIDFPLNWLPETGYIAYYTGMPIAACFLFETNSQVAWLAWPIASKNAPKEARDVALKLVFDKLEERAKFKGFKTVFTTTRHPSVAHRLTSMGYNKGDENITQYFKGVQ